MPINRTPIIYEQWLFFIQYVYQYREDVTKHPSECQNYSFLFFFIFFLSFVFSRKDRYYLIYVFLLNMISFIYSSRRFLSLFYLILWYMYMIEMMKFFLWKESMKFFCRNCNFINCYIVNVYVSIKNPLRILFFLSFFFLILIIIFIIMWIFFFFYNIKRLLFDLVSINWWLFLSLKFLFGWILIVT